jgi:hypothetical protein
MKACLPDKYPGTPAPFHVLEVQVIGPLTLREDSKALRAHVVFENTPYQAKLEALSREYGTPIQWIDGPVFAPPVGGPPR